MYSQHSGTYNSPPPELSNNPFIDHPSNAHARYPDISGGDIPSGSSQFTSWVQSPVSGNPGAGYGGGQALGMSSQNNNSLYSQQQPQQPSWGAQQGYQGNYGGSGFASQPLQTQPTGLPFQPTSSFGQHLAGQMNGGYGSVPQQQTQYSGYPTTSQYGQGMQQGYGAQPQPPQQQNTYISEFDPYGSRAGGSQLPSQAQGTQGTINGAAQYNTPHPREYIRDHKLEMEQWDQYTWKQTLNCFEALKEAWGARKRELETRAKAFGGAGLFGGGNYGAMYGGQAQQLAQLEQMVKEAESNFDSVAASTFQMQEVFTGYRQSGDLASKRRVRESINAALSSLPDWPPRLY